MPLMHYSRAITCSDLVQMSGCRTFSTESGASGHCEDAKSEPMAGHLITRNVQRDRVSAILAEWRAVLG